MTTLLERAIETARGLPSDQQDDVARLMLMFVGQGQESQDELTAEDEAAVLRSRLAAERGEFATDEQLQAIRSKHGL